ncbi:MAG: hypothetical protein AB1450_08360 [Pseudomonadota bacterium]
MTQLSDADADKLAETLINKVREHKHDFWIDPEKHYQDHAKLSGLGDEDIRTLHDLIQAFRNARSLFWRAFLGFAIIGSLVAVAVGMGFSK